MQLFPGLTMEEISRSYGYLYLVTNKITGVSYVGQSRKVTPKDVESYLGSGDFLRDAIRQVGRQNFEKKVLAVAQNQIDLDILEIQMIAVARDDGTELYNGGIGGPRVQSDLIRWAMTEFGCAPQMTTAWRKFVIGEEAALRRFLQQFDVDTPSFYMELERQLLQTQDLRVECPRCKVSVGEVCRTKTGNPTTNHASRRINDNS